MNSIYLCLALIFLLKSELFSLDAPTYGQQLLTFAGLAESHYAVHIDAGLWLVTVLHEAEGLEVKSCNLGKAIACHQCPLLYGTAGGNRSQLVSDVGVNFLCATVVRFRTRRRNYAAQSGTCCKRSGWQSNDPAAHES